MHSRARELIYVCDKLTRTHPQAGWNCEKYVRARFHNWKLEETP
jgi:hypothetical protein